MNRAGPPQDGCLVAARVWTARLDRDRRSPTCGMTLLRRAQGRIVLIEPAGARLNSPFAGPLTAVSATLRAELARWHIDVTLTEPGAAAGAITRALTAPRPRATSPSPWFGLYDQDPASSASLRADARARATPHSVHKRRFLCYFLAHAC